MLKTTQPVDETPVRFRFGSAEFDPQRLELRIAGELVDAQRKPLEILAQLLTNAGAIVTREHLLDSVWDGRPVVDNVIASAITKLRTALGAEISASLITHPKVGYRWCGEVEIVAGFVPALARAEYQPGIAVPHRRDFSFVQKLDSSSHNDVWSAAHNATADRRIYKFALTKEGLGALRREAALLQILRHALGERTEVVQAVDWNFDQAPFFIAYPFAGSNLADWAVTGGALSAASSETRLNVFLKIAAAVQAAHSAGIVHQDLKPANIMIRAAAVNDWDVRLTDFGSGRLLQSERVASVRITQFGLLNAEALTSCSSSATPLYLAPELLACQPASEQSDIYALGVLLYQLLAGDLNRPLGLGWERQIDDELLQEDIARATDLDPARRFASVAELCERITLLEDRRDRRQQAFEREQASIIRREQYLCSRARRGWMIATIILSVVVVIQSVLLIVGASTSTPATSQQTPQSRLD